MAPLQVASCIITDMPKLGASLKRVLRCMMVSNTISSKWFRTSSTTWLLRRRRTSYMVNKMPSTFNVVFKRVCTIFMVLSNLPSPSSAKYSHCTGIITESAAVNELMVIKPNDGEQSMIIKSYSWRRPSSTSFILNSRFSRLIISISAPTRSICAGSKSRFGVSVCCMASCGSMLLMMHS